MESRTKNSFKNIRISIAGEGLNVLLGLVARKIFVTVLSVEYLGLSSLFANILTLLSITELGIFSAINCLLYKPIAENNHKKIVSILAVYKKLCIAIGMIVGIVGVALTPLLPFIIKEMPDIPNIYLIYILYVLNSASSYFFAYKRELIISYQYRYIYSLYSMGAKFIMYIAQIVILLLTNNYILYLLAMIMATIGENVALAAKANKLFPYLNKIEPDKLEKEDIDNVKSKVIGSSFHKIGDALVIGTDNILISSLVGIVETGLYANYILIVNVINTVLSIVYSSVIASAGNLGAKTIPAERVTTFNRINFFAAWSTGFSSCCFLVLLNPFISLWLGNEFLLDNITVVAIVISFYLTSMKRPVAMMRDALGVFTYDKYKVIPEVIINFIVSIVLGKEFGIVGIIIGTIVSNLCTTFWISPLILYKYGFETSVSNYMKKYGCFSLVSVVAAVLCVLLANSVLNTGIIGFLLKMIICCFIPNIIFVTFYHKTSEYTYFKELVIRVIFRKNKSNE